MTFDLSTSQIFLTYPQATFSRDDLVNFLKHVREGLGRLLVAREEHQDGGIHFHAYLRYRSKVRIRSERFFDLQGKTQGVTPVRLAPLSGV